MFTRGEVDYGVSIYAEYVNDSDPTLNLYAFYP